MATKVKPSSVKTGPRVSGYLSQSPRVVVGTGREVSTFLRLTPTRRTLAVTFQNENELAAAEEVYRRVGEILPQLMRSRQQEKLNKVIEGLLPEMALSRAALLQAGMQAEAKAHILSSGDYVRASEIAKLAGYSENNPSAQPSKWKREAAIFAIEHNGADYFPLYGLNPEKSYKPYPALSEVLDVFHGMRSEWSIAFWFAGLNSFLNDQRPQDLLACKPESVIAAARDEVEGLQHG
jgi:hypothetical protein